MTNIPGIHALTTWWHYIAGCVVGQRIEELVQLSVDGTTVQALDGNRLLWALDGLTYQLFSVLRGRLPGGWQTAEPGRLPVWFVSAPGRYPRHGDQSWFNRLAAELNRGLFGLALAALRGSPRNVHSTPPGPEPPNGAGPPPQGSVALDPRSQGPIRPPICVLGHQSDAYVDDIPIPELR